MRVLPFMAVVTVIVLPFPAAAEPPMLAGAPLKIIGEMAPTATPVAVIPPTNTAESKSLAAAPRPKPPTIIAKISLTTQRLELSVAGKAEASWPISSGRSEFPTPRGVFRPQWASKLWFSKKYDNAPMPHAVFFNGGVAVHATQSTGLLGQPASHGCVRLSPANAARFYELVHKHGFQNTRIEVFGTPPATRIARRSNLPPVRMASNIAAPKASNGWEGWSQPAPSRTWGVAQQPPLRRAANGIVYLPPGSPLQGRASFVHNGITYVRVR